MARPVVPLRPSIDRESKPPTKIVERRPEDVKPRPTSPPVVTPLRPAKEPEAASEPVVPLTTANAEDEAKAQVDAKAMAEARAKAQTQAKAKAKAEDDAWVKAKAEAKALAQAKAAAQAKDKAQFVNCMH